MVCQTCSCEESKKKKIDCFWQVKNGSEFLKATPPFRPFMASFAFIKNNWMQLRSLVRRGLDLLRNFLFDTIGLVNLFSLSWAFRLFHRHNTCVFYRSVVWPPSGICHRSTPSYDSKAGWFGLTRGVLPIFSQVSALFNQELYTCFPWQAQSLGCPEPFLVDGREECFLSNSPDVHYVHAYRMTKVNEVSEVFALELFLNLLMIEGRLVKSVPSLVICDSVPDGMMLLTSQWSAAVKSHQVCGKTWRGAHLFTSAPMVKSINKVSSVDRLITHSDWQKRCKRLWLCVSILRQI